MRRRVDNNGAILTPAAAFVNMTAVYAWPPFFI